MGGKLAEEMGDYASRVSHLSSLGVYRAVAGLLNALPWGPRRLRESLAGRRHAAERWAGWTGSRTIWFHAASVGEALAAEPVMRRVRTARPDLPLILTHSSASVARWPNPFPVARMDFAPAENARDMHRAFVALRPALLVFSRSDLWPEMLLAAYDHGVPVAVLGGTVSPGSLRLSGPARAFLRPLYGTIRFVGALSEWDGSRWRELGVPPDAIVVTGDPRGDQVLERPARMNEVRRLGAWAAEGPTLVAGSVEPEDVFPLINALRSVRARHEQARMLVVPHDPSSAVADRFRGVPNCVIVETVGALADLYLLAEVAYVGGGHSRLEPAAYGIPTLPARDILARRWIAWLDDPKSARSAGLAARRNLTAGAASTTVARLLPLVR